MARQSGYPDVKAVVKGTTAYFVWGVCLGIISMPILWVYAVSLDKSSIQDMPKILEDHTALVWALGLLVSAVAAYMAGYYAASRARHNPIMTALLVALFCSMIFVASVIGTMPKWQQIFAAALDYPFMLLGACVFVSKSRNKKNVQAVT